jgi:uncharacterized protein YbjT (DUF2867 family)
MADFFDITALKTAFGGGEVLFLITPENPASRDVLGETCQIIRNYREAITASGIRKIVGLSSMGAQHPSGTGNLEQSYMLEHAFVDLPVEQTFIRPAYYFSNWLGYRDTAGDYGILPTFFPAGLKVQMVAPADVANFALQLMMADKPYKPFYEVGEKYYSSIEVASVFGKKLQRNVEVQQIPREQWEGTLSQVGFSENAATNLIKMTEAVLNGRTQPENPLEVVNMPTSLVSYFETV